MTTVYIALGSNLGDRLANLRAAVALLAENGIDVVAKSSVWQTAPVPADQPPFLNAAVRAETELAPLDLLDALKRIEWALGRRPERHWGPRPVDLDILFCGEEELVSERLTIPHERIVERNFVLAPLADVLPGPLPVIGKSATGLLAVVGSAGLERTGRVL